MVMIVRMRMSSAEWSEDALLDCEADVLPIEKLSQCGIICHSHHTFLHLQLEMEVADNPAEPGRCGRIGAECYLQYGLRLLRNGISRPFRENDVSVAERMLEIEAELASILGDSAPTPLCQCESVYRNGNAWKAGIDVVEVVVNQLHQKRKYRWAIGRTDAGSQRSSRPSAFTV